MKNLEISTERFFLRNLNAEDVTEKYFNWLQDPVAKKYIDAASQTDGINHLKKYVNEKTARSDTLFIGIFDKENMQHIGNIKYEPIDLKLKYAIMGILIGESEYRGKGVTSEVLKASAEWLHDRFEINKILLGVDLSNKAAIRAYEKIGFTVTETPYIQTNTNTISMVLDLSKD